MSDAYSRVSLRRVYIYVVVLVYLNFASVFLRNPSEAFFEREVAHVMSISGGLRRQWYVLGIM